MVSNYSEWCAMISNGTEWLQIVMNDANGTEWCSDDCHLIGGHCILKSVEGI